MSARVRSSVGAAVFALLVAACGSDAATSSEPTTIASTTTVTTTTTTTTSTTITPTTSAPPPIATGWSKVDPAAVSVKAIPPCCADTWHGDVSPALAPEGQPLADGAYAVKAQWPDDLRQPLQLELFRFEQCALLPEFSCEPQGPQFAPTDLGVDTSVSRPLTVALDDSVRVVVVGWDDATLDSNEQFVVEQTTGTGLAALAAQVDQAYADVFADRFVAGEDPDAIVADVLAHPRGGFSPSVRGNGFMFAPESGPPLMFQSPERVFPFVDDQRVAGRGTDVLAIRSIDVVDGQVTLYVYSGYYP